MRRPLRLACHDYSSPDGYFVTLVTRHRHELFGSLDSSTDQLRLNAAGRMVQHRWLELPRKFPEVALDAFVVMPDHVHGILVLNCARINGHAVSLSGVMRWLKTVTTTDYLRGVHGQRWPRITRHLWQRSFYDHIIRTEADLLAIRDYVLANPGALWEQHASAEAHFT